MQITKPNSVASRDRRMAARFSLLFLTSLLIPVAVAQVQNYPVKPITLIVPSAAGGPSDVLARTLGAAMTKRLNQPILVENVGGAGGNIGVLRAARAAPDGYTIMMQNIGMALSTSLYRKLDYDPLADFDYIGIVALGSMALIARANFPAKDFGEFITYVKANKERLSFANSGIGGPSHLCGLLFTSAIGVQLLNVPYKGTGPAMNDLVGGQVDISCDSVSTAAPQIKSGKIRALGVTGKARATLLPDLPTLDEQGLKGFEMTTWQAMYAPKRLPSAVRDRLVEGLQGALRDSDFGATLVGKLGIEPASAEAATPAALQAHLKAEIDKWGPLIRKAGVFAE